MEFFMRKHLSCGMSAVLGATLLAAFTPVSAQAIFPAANATVAPSKDAFYKSPTAAVLNAAAPGAVLRYRTTPNTSYASSVKEVYQVMYRTTDGQGTPTAAVTTLLIPTAAPATGRKLLAFQSFYDSLSLDCSPSGLTLSNKLFEKNTINPALKAGVLVAMADYEGLQSQWIAGPNTAHGVLDGIRAVENFSKSGLNKSTPVALMGYSGGGHASAWANEVAPEYAPELNIVGSAMGGIPVDLLNVAKKVDGTLFAPVYFGAVVGLSRAHPEIDPNKYATAAGKDMIADMGNRCLLGSLQGKPDMLIAKYMFQKGSKFLNDANFLDLPEIKAIGEINKLGKRVPMAPMYIFEGSQDEIMPLADVDALVQGYCAAGKAVQYNRVAIGDHLSLALSTAPSINYVLDRLDGKPAPTNCK
jgi:hypothetical protein